jgi:hypothetical protein
VRGVLKGQTVTIDRSYQAGTPLAVIQHDDGGMIDGEFKFPQPGANALIMKAPDGTIGHHAPLVNITGSHVRWSVDVRNSLGRGVGVSDASNVELREFTVDWSRNAGVHLHSVQNVRCYQVQNRHAGCYYQQPRDPSKYNWPVAFNVVYSKNVVVDSCESSQNWGEGIALGRGTADSKIVGSIFADNMALNLYMHRCERSQALRNLVYCTSANPCPGIVVNNEDNFTGTVVNNLLIGLNVCIGNRFNLSVWGNETSGVVSQDVMFLFNTSINGRGEGKAGGMLLRAKGARKLRVYGNLFYQKDGRYFEIEGAPEDCLFENNCWGGATSAPPALVTGKGIAGVQLTKPDAPYAYGNVKVESYAPTKPYAIPQIPEVEDKDFLGRKRQHWSVGAIDHKSVEVPEDEEDPTTSTPLVLKLMLDGEGAEALRKLLTQARIVVG